VSSLPEALKSLLWAAVYDVLSNHAGSLTPKQQAVAAQIAMRQPYRLGWDDIATGAALMACVELEQAKAMAEAAE